MGTSPRRFAHQRHEGGQTDLGLEICYVRCNGSAIHKVVAVDPSLKRNILRCLTYPAAIVTVVPSNRQGPIHNGRGPGWHLLSTAPAIRSDGRPRRAEIDARLPGKPVCGTALAIRCWPGARRQDRRCIRASRAKHPVKGDFTTQGRDPPR